MSDQEGWVVYTGDTLPEPPWVCFDPNDDGCPWDWCDTLVSAIAFPSRGIAEEAIEAWDDHGDWTILTLEEARLVAQMESL